MTTGTDVEKGRFAYSYGRDKVEREADGDHGERSAKLWSVYVDESQKQDAALVDSWKGDMDGLLIFAGLFSAVVTAFLVESLHLLQLDTGQTSVLLLERISLQLEGNATATSTRNIPPLPLTSNRSARGSPLRVNILWCLSLLLSLLCALCATLIQQWARNYQQAIERRSAPHQRARIRAFLFQGIENSGARAIVDGIPTLLHVAVFLFIAGMYDFIVPSNRPVALLSIVILGIYGGLYIALSTMPVQTLDSPYRTPLSAGMWHLKQMILPLRFQDLWSHSITVATGSLAQGREAYAMRASTGRNDRDLKALSSTLATLTEHGGFEPFIEGVPGFLQSERVIGAQYIMHELLKQNNLGEHIIQMLDTCIDPVALPEGPRRKRSLTGFNAIMTLTQGWDNQHDKSWSMCFGPDIATTLLNLESVSDPVIAIHARCTRTIVTWKLLNDYGQMASQARQRISAFEAQLHHLSKGTAPSKQAEKFITRVPEEPDEVVNQFRNMMKTDMLAAWLASMHQMFLRIDPQDDIQPWEVESTYLVLMTQTWKSHYGSVPWNENTR